VLLRYSPFSFAVPARYSEGPLFRQGLGLVLGFGLGIGLGSALGCGQLHGSDNTFTHKVGVAKPIAV